MCHGWYEERLWAEQERLAKQKIDELKSLERAKPTHQPAPEPERRKDTQPDPVPV